MEKNNDKKFCNGFGSVNYNKSRKNWRVYYKEYDVNSNKEIRKTKTFSTFKKAKDYLILLEAQRNSESYTPTKGIELGLLLKAVIEKKYETGIIADRQYSRLKETLKMLDKSSFINKSIEEISSYEIQGYLNALRKKYSESTINKVMQLLKQGFERGIQKGYITKNPLQEVIKPKSEIPTKVVRALEIYEQQTLSEYLFRVPIYEEKYKNVYLTQMYMGLRIGESLALNIDDVDLDKRIIKVNKTLTRDKDNKTIIKDSPKTVAGIREVPIPSSLLKTLEEQIELAKNNQSNILFPGNDGYMNSANVNVNLKRISKGLGLPPITTHMLRHTFGTRCMEAGMRAVALQRIMGHSDISVTLNTYTSVLNKYKEDEINKIDKYYHENELVPKSNKMKDGDFNEL